MNYYIRLSEEEYNKMINNNVDQYCFSNDLTKLSNLLAKNQLKFDFRFAKLYVTTFGYHSNNYYFLIDRQDVDYITILSNVDYITILSKHINMVNMGRIINFDEIKVSSQRFIDSNRSDSTSEYCIIIPNYSLCIDHDGMHYVVNKLQDDYYSVMKYPIDVYSDDNWQFYKCDQMDGLMKCISDLCVGGGLNESQYYSEIDYNQLGHYRDSKDLISVSEKEVSIVMEIASNKNAVVGVRRQYQTSEKPGKGLRTWKLERILYLDLEYRVRVTSLHQLPISLQPPSLNSNLVNLLDIKLYKYDDEYWLAEVKRHGYAITERKILYVYWLDSYEGLTEFFTMINKFILYLQSTLAPPITPTSSFRYESLKISKFDNFLVKMVSEIDYLHNIRKANVEITDDILDRICRHFIPEDLKVKGEYDYTNDFSHLFLYKKAHKTTAPNTLSGRHDSNVIVGKYRKTVLWMKLLADDYWIVFSNSSKHTKRQSKFYFMIDGYDGLTQFFNGLESIDSLNPQWL